MKESMSTFEFYQFGLEHVFGISAINGSGTGDMLDHLAEQLYERKRGYKQGDEIPRIAIVGKP